MLAMHFTDCMPENKVTHVKNLHVYIFFDPFDDKWLHFEVSFDVCNYEYANELK